MLYGYHYTRIERFHSMAEGSDYGKKGLLPLKRFMNLHLAERGDPPQITEGIVEALSEPLPRSWTHPTRHPDVLLYLFSDILSYRGTALLRFPIAPTEDAYVFDRGTVEDVLYSGTKESRTPDPTRMRAALLEAYRTRVPAYEYAGGFTLPQYAIWNAIPLERLEVVSVRNGDEIWNEACERMGVPEHKRVVRTEELCALAKTIHCE
jgi:hypothetical protein